MFLRRNIHNTTTKPKPKPKALLRSLKYSHTRKSSSCSSLSSSSSSTTTPGRLFHSFQTNTIILILLLTSVFFLYQIKTILDQITPPSSSTTITITTTIEEENKECSIPYQTTTPNPQKTLSTLKTLNLSNCNLKSIPPLLTKYATNLQHLDLSNNPQLTTLPPSFANLQKLEILFVSNCTGIKTALPKVLGQMTSLTRLGWKSGSLTTLSPSTSIPPNLVHLILTNNDIQNLSDPDIFERLKHVKKLMLSHNSISYINEEGLKKMKELELIRLGGNKLERVPGSLWTLPKLSWVTLSGNPIITDTQQQFWKMKQKNNDDGGGGVVVPMVDFSVLKFPTPSFKGGGGGSSFAEIKSLGQGASGKVLPAIYNNQKVAVKRIHSVTSDGRPEDELMSYGVLDAYAMEERFVGAIALFQDTTKNNDGGGGGDNGIGGGGGSGIIMKQLPSNLIDLAQPPTIVEVTKDRWKQQQQKTFTKSFILNVLKDISRALHYLHYDIGIVHGDVYAHNIKVDPKTGRAYLLDLGASYLVPPPPSSSSLFSSKGFSSQKAERLEVRAFGVLMDELLERYDDDNGYGRKKGKDDELFWLDDLRLLRDRCLMEDVSLRPSFEYIVLSLSSL